MAAVLKPNDILPEPFLNRRSGVYAIVNRDNNKVYVGSAVRLNHRQACHRHDLLKNQHNSILLQRAFNKSPGSFYFEIIEEVPVDFLLRREQFWLDFYRSYLPQNGYNICPEAASCRGVVRSADFRRKISESGKGPWSDERKQRWREIRKRTQPKGWRWKDGDRKRHNQHLKGKPLSQEHAAKILAANRIAERGFNKKRVLQFDISGSLIQKFGCISDAELKFGRRGNIHACCKGKRRTAFGFVWKYG